MFQGLKRFVSRCETLCSITWDKVELLLTGNYQVNNYEAG